MKIKLIAVSAGVVALSAGGAAYVRGHSSDNRAPSAAMKSFGDSPVKSIGGGGDFVRVEAPSVAFFARPSTDLGFVGTVMEIGEPFDALSFPDDKHSPLQANEVTLRVDQVVKGGLKEGQTTQVTVLDQTYPFAVGRQALVFTHTGSLGDLKSVTAPTFVGIDTNGVWLDSEAGEGDGGITFGAKELDQISKLSASTSATAN